LKKKNGKRTGGDVVYPFRGEEKRKKAYFWEGRVLRKAWDRLPNRNGFWRGGEFEPTEKASLASREEKQVCARGDSFSRLRKTTSLEGGAVLAGEEGKLA